MATQLNSIIIEMRKFPVNRNNFPNRFSAPTNYFVTERMSDARRHEMIFICSLIQINFDSVLFRSGAVGTRFTSLIARAESEPYRLMTSFEPPRVQRLCQKAFVQLKARFLHFGFHKPKAWRHINLFMTFMTVLGKRCAAALWGTEKGFGKYF